LNSIGLVLKKFYPGLEANGNEEERRECMFCRLVKKMNVKMIRRIHLEAYHLIQRKVKTIKDDKPTKNLS